MRFLSTLILVCAMAFTATAQYIPDENTKTPPPETTTTPSKKKVPILKAPWTQKPKASTEKPTPGSGEEAQVSYTIERLFDYMRDSDGNGVKTLFSADARLMGTGLDNNGRPTIKNTAISDFATRISQAKKGALDEKITSMEVRIDENLASAWVGYDFYYEGEFHHCGVDAVQLHKGTSGWKIIQLADTQRDECARPADDVNAVMDGWHMAASNSDIDSYIERMNPSGIFLGTDESENWDRKALYNYAKPVFDKRRGWAFTIKERNVFLSEDGNVSWFNEVLETSMGPCRGSGILSKDENGAWRIDQYNLAMLVPNDLIQDYLALRKEKGM